MRHWQQTQRKSSHRDHSHDRCDDVFIGFLCPYQCQCHTCAWHQTQQPNSSQVQQLKTKDVQVVVTLGKENIIQVDGKDVTLQNLTTAVQNKAGQADQIAVIVNSDKGAEVQTLIDVMDEIKKSGIGKVSLAARERK